MGRIKSAWEIALEKTEQIEVDEVRVRHNTHISEIKYILGSYLTNEERKDDELKEKLSQYKRDEIKEAGETIILNSLFLPQEAKDNSEKETRVETLLSIALENNEEAISLLRSIFNHTNQYPKHKEELISKLKEQLEPMLKQKEERMRAQYGEAIHLTIESDKEAMETVKNYTERLFNQYQETLDEAKNQLKTFFAI